MNNYVDAVGFRGRAREEYVVANPIHVWCYYIVISEVGKCAGARVRVLENIVLIMIHSIAMF